MATFTPAEIAARQGFRTDAKTLRIFLRADAAERGVKAPGKGSRWAIEGRELSSMGARFRRWEQERAAKAEAKASEAVQADAEAEEAVELEEDQETDEG